MSIELKVRKVVEQCGKSQHQLGTESSLSQVAVHKFLKRGMHLSGDKLERLANAAGHRITITAADSIC